MMFSKFTNKCFLLTFLVLFAVTSKIADAGPIMAGCAVALCYTACNAGYVTCMTGAGLSAGMVGPLAFAAGAACSVAQGACMSTCIATGLATAVAPTP